MYEYTNINLLKNPNIYQFSDVSDDDFLGYYIEQRKLFLASIENELEDSFCIFSNNCLFIEYQEILKLQKRFEVKKTFFEEYNKNISFITLFSFELSIYLKKNFCLSLFSTLLKLNDTLSSLEVEDFSSFEIYLLNISIRNELNFVESLNNE